MRILEEFPQLKKHIWDKNEISIYHCCSSNLRRNTFINKNVMYSSSTVYHPAQWWKVCTNQKTENFPSPWERYYLTYFEPFRSCSTTPSCTSKADFYLYFGMTITNNGRGLGKKWTAPIFSAFGCYRQTKKEQKHK